MSEDGYGALEVVAVGYTGEPIPKVELELTSAATHAVVAGVFGKARVPYGTYRLHVYSQGFVSLYRDVKIAVPNTTLRVQLSVGTIGGCPDPPAYINGIIKGEHTGSELWVKAIPVRGVGGGESRVDGYGRFLVDSLERTAYILLVIDGEKILHQQVVRTYPAGRTTLAIDLK